MTPVLVFDIETIPDIAGLRRVHDVPAGVEDDGVLHWAVQQRRAQSGNDFLALQFQRIVAISCALRDESSFRVWSLGDLGDPEPVLIRRFFDGIDRYTPQLVSWNGGGFDLPVLHYRALVHGISAGRYWDWGDQDKEFRYNNYLNRYHTRHLDLMDVLSAFQPRAAASLDAMARLCGFPGKLGMDGSAVHAAVAAGELDSVRRYCETDVMNTYLLFLRFQLLRGLLSQDEYKTEVAFARDRITATGAVHWVEFVAAWDKA
ncbi:MAG: 3'-5' exonuclease [Pseudomonadota bacterium]|nr:3'-5' exonuclease [Pseudomonadota bacterium]